jgi:hypothetical protein
MQETFKKFCFQTLEEIFNAALIKGFFIYLFI